MKGGQACVKRGGMAVTAGILTFDGYEGMLQLFDNFTMTMGCITLLIGKMILLRHSPHKT